MKPAIVNIQGKGNHAFRKGPNHLVTMRQVTKHRAVSWKRSYCFTYHFAPTLVNQRSFKHSHFSETPGTDPSRVGIMHWLDGEPLEFLWPRDGERSTSEEKKHRWTVKL